MKVVILAGGMQSSISNEMEGIPKPMVDIGGKPLIWHIMKHFSQYGFTEFIVCGGYKVNKIKEYFMDFYIYESDITVDLQTNTVEIHKNKTEDWKVTVVDTGLFSATGQRVRMIENYVDGDFIVTYGDCLSDIDICRLVEYHCNEGKVATITMVKPSGRDELLPIDALEPAIETPQRGDAPIDRRARIARPINFAEIAADAAIAYRKRIEFGALGPARIIVQIDVIGTDRVRRGIAFDAKGIAKRIDRTHEPLLRSIMRRSALTILSVLRGLSPFFTLRHRGPP